MMALLLAAGACLAAGLAATWFLYSKRLPSERRVAGRALLAAMDHAGFMQLVLAVLNGRGFERTFGGGGTEGEYLVERHGRGWLLSSRYSHAYTPDSTAIAEFANYLRHRGVPGGVLAITGRFPRAAFAVARAHRIDLLDSDNMWEELQPLLDDAQHAAIDGPARSRLKWLFVLAWLAAVAIGAAVFLGERQAEAHMDAMAVAMSARAPLPASPASGADGVPVATAASSPSPPPAGADDDTPPRGNAVAVAAAMVRAPAPAVATGAPAAADAAARVADRRRAIAESVGRLPHVRSAAWPAPSTLQVVVDSELFDPRERLCPLLENDPDLGASRLQVQYPASSARPVRFLQCRAY
jgi:hypothetical protein